MPRSKPRSRLLAALALALCAACDGGDPPRLVVSTAPATSVAAAAPIVTTRVQLQNLGGRALLLDGLVPACGCASTAGMPARLDPGARAFVDVACRLPPTGSATFRELRLRSSDPAAPDQALRVSLPAAKIGPDPATLYFGYVAIGSSAIRDVALPDAVAIDGLPTPGPVFNYEPVPPRLAAGRSGLRVRFAPRGPGVVRATLDLGPAGTIDAIGVGYANVLAYPAEVRVPSPAHAGNLPAITLIGIGTEPLDVTRIDYPAGLGGELRTVVPGHQFRLVLRARGGGTTAGDAIRLRTGDVEEPVVSIPVVRDQPAS